MIPALRRQRQVDLCEFEASLVYKASSRTARAVTQRNPVLEKNGRKTKPFLAEDGTQWQTGLGFQVSFPCVTSVSPCKLGV